MELTTVAAMCEELEKIAAHKKLKKGKHSVGSAMKEGFTRGKKKEAVSKEWLTKAIQGAKASPRRVDKSLKKIQATETRSVHKIGKGKKGFHAKQTEKANHAVHELLKRPLPLPSWLTKGAGVEKIAISQKLINKVVDKSFIRPERIGWSESS